MTWAGIAVGGVGAAALVLVLGYPLPPAGNDAIRMSVTAAAVLAGWGGANAGWWAADRLGRRRGR